MCKDNKLEIESLAHAHSQGILSLRLHSVNDIKYRLFQWSLSCLNKDQMSRPEMLPRKGCLGNVASNMILKTLGLLLRRPNIALVIVRPFQIDPYKSNDGATYSLIVGQYCLKETRTKTFSFFEQVDASRYLLKSNFFTPTLFSNKVFKTTS